MKIKPVLFFFLLCFFVSKNYAQQDSLLIATKTVVPKNQIAKEAYDPLAPARAAFYSAVLPGLGQAHNKNYWKIPVIYAGIGTSIYIYHSNNEQYHRYRDAYKRRVAGHMDDEFIDDNGNPIVSTDGLIAAQKLYQRNKEMSILVAVGFYILNIVDANVTAHLRQFNVSEDLTLKPAYEFDDFSGNQNFGLSLNFNF